MDKVSRRRAMTIMAAGGAGAALTSLAGVSEANALDHTAIMTTEEQAATVIPAARAFSGQHSPKPLPFDPAKLKGISEKLIRSHWENNYSGSCCGFNIHSVLPCSRDLRTDEARLKIPCIW